MEATDLSQKAYSIHVLLYLTVRSWRNRLYSPMREGVNAVSSSSGNDKDIGIVYWAFGQCKGQGCQSPHPGQHSQPCHALKAVLGQEPGQPGSIESS